MAIEKNDVNFLTDIQIGAENNRVFFTDVRNILIFTKEFNIEPTYITNPQEIIDLNISGLTVEHDFYKFIASAYSQKFIPVNVVIYGNSVATNFTDAITTYKNHEKAFEVTNWITNMNAKENKEYIKSMVAYAKTDKRIQMGISLEREKFTQLSELIAYQTEANIENVLFVVEGSENIKLGNWLNAAIFGGTIGAKELGSYITHSTQIVGFVQEKYTPTEQVTMKKAGLSFLSKPVQGYFHLVNGINSDNKVYTELNLIKIWTQDRIEKELIKLMVVKDKIPVNDSGIALLDATIREVCRQGASQGMYMVDSTGNYFGTITQKDVNGNELALSLGYLTVGTITNEVLREGNLSFKLRLTYLNGVRHLELRGIVSTEGELVIK